MTGDIKSQVDETIRELEVAAGRGDPAAQYKLFVFLNAKAMEEYDTAIFNRAEEILQRSADAGWPQAKEMIKAQSIRRHGFEGRVRRNEKP